MRRTERAEAGKCLGAKSGAEEFYVESMINKYLVAVVDRNQCVTNLRCKCKQNVSTNP